MSFRELEGKHIFYITCSLYLTQSYFNCIVVPIFDYCDTHLIFALLRLITIAKHYYFHTIVLVYRILLHLVPAYLQGICIHVF